MRWSPAIARRPGPFRDAMLRRGFALILSIAVSPATVFAANKADQLHIQATAFFEQNCLDCHESGTTKGGLNLEKVDALMSSEEQVDIWTRIYDRVAKGEMPPAKRERPDPAKMRELLAMVRPRLLAADRNQREVVQRRLNRTEYENTVRDLLAVDIDLRDLLPEDQQAGGFDNNGRALAVSTEQMQAYLEAARFAVDSAIVTTARPKTEMVTVDSLAEVQRYIDSGDFGYVDGRVVAYVTNDSTYSKISTRAKRTPVRGRYRFQFQAAAENTNSLQFFTLSASNFAGVAATSTNLGYFEVGPQPKTFEVEAVLDAKSAVQLFALGLPGYVKKNAGSKHTGVGFGAVTVTGPIIDQWPPESHARLLGSVELSKGTVSDAEQILRRFLPRAFRRPVTDIEVDRFLDLVRRGLAGKHSFHESLRASLVAALCSPNFLYLVEKHDPNSKTISDTELASRLSYFAWSSMPDEELLRLAASGKLREPANLKSQLERLLQSPRAEAFITNFVGQWLKLRQINDTTPDRKLYRKFDELLQMSMVNEGEGFFREVLHRDLPISDFLDSKWAMINQRLAEHYGIDGVTGLNLRKVPLPPGHVRGGVLTQAGVLKVTANGTTTSPVLRGVWVLENILGQPTPPPPPNTGGIEPDIRGAVTIRQQLDQHRNDESCNVCHRLIDPPGFALESFDPIGDYREKYLRWVVTNEEKGYGNVKPGANVDPSGKLAAGEPFKDIRDFKKHLLERKHDFVHCLTEKLLTYALGRDLGFSDRESINAIARETESRGGGLRTLVHAIVQSEPFRSR
jgi:mono/diheme cytochrome c family protein